MPTVGIIGIGNMGNAILHGILDAGYVKAPNLVLYDPKIEILEKLSREQPSITYCDHALELARISDVIILAVKPNIVASVIDSISPALKEKTVVSIAAGWTCSMLRSNLEPHGASYIRVMPNTPALVGEGMTALCSDYTAPEEVFQFVQGIFDALGRTVILDEKLFDGVIAISGSSPAYVYMLIETMAQAGVRYGIPMHTAIEMSAQAVLGSALMVLSSGNHPAELRDAVCSPAGTTIDAVAALEENGFRSSLLQAMEACVEKSKKMSK